MQMVSCPQRVHNLQGKHKRRHRQWPLEKMPCWSEEVTVPLSILEGTMIKDASLPSYAGCDVSKYSEGSPWKAGWQDLTALKGR